MKLFQYVDGLWPKVIMRVFPKNTKYSWIGKEKIWSIKTFCFLNLEVGRVAVFCVHEPRVLNFKINYFSNSFTYLIQLFHLGKYSNGAAFQRTWIKQQ